MKSFARHCSTLVGTLCLSLLGLSAALPAQMLARPGWAGSGMTLESWWSHAILYQIDPHSFQDGDGNGTGDLKGVVKQLDYVRSLGVDAIVLTHLFPQQGDAAKRFQSIDPAIGTLDDFEDVLREAGRDNLHVLVEVDPQPLSDPAALSNVARFWLAQGAGGISLHGAAPATDAQLQAVHQAVHSFAGGRILVADAAPGNAAAARKAGADLVLDPSLATVKQLSAGSLRTVLEGLQTSPNPASLAFTDGPGLERSAARYADGSHNIDIEKVLATALLATHANAQLYFGQEIGLSRPGAILPWGVPPDPKAKKKPAPPAGPEVLSEDADSDSVLSWYRRLIDLHHGNGAIRNGESQFLDHDAENALVWVAKRPPVSPLSPAIVVICNVSAQPLRLSLADDMRKLHLRGFFLRPILRSDHGMGGMGLDSIRLPAYGIYIGELRL